MSASLSLSPNAFIVVLPFSFTPFLIDSAAFASVNPACTFASVRSFAFSVFPILVSALPSLPWHWTQFASQFALASAASDDIALARMRLNTRARAVFIFGSFLMDQPNEFELLRRTNSSARSAFLPTFFERGLPNAPSRELALLRVADVGDRKNRGQFGNCASA